MKYPILVLLVLLLVHLPTIKSQKKLIFVQQLFRHGARYPIFPNPLDGSNYTTDENSLGELTTQGKNMHYLLGRKVYAQYWDKLFKGTVFENQYNNSKFYFKATDVNRTIQSCQSHLVGLFDSLPKLTITRDQVNFSKPLWPGAEAFQGQVFPTAPQYRPIAIHVQKLGTSYNDEGDFLRAYSPQNCPLQDTWQKQNQQTSFVKQIYANENFTRSLAELSKVLKRNVSFEEEGYFYDNFETTSYLGRPTLPIYTDPNHKRELLYIYTLDMYINLFYNEQQIRTTSDGFFKATLKNIDRAISKRDVQWVIYSAHDTTVGNMLTALNLTNVACIYEAYLKGDDYNKDTCVSNYPGYTANLIFQVWDDRDTSLQTIKIRYLGEYRKIPFCNYQYECPVSKMKTWYEESIKIKSYASNCGLSNEDKQFYKAIAVLQFGVIITFLIYLLMKYLKTPVALLQSKKEEKNLVKSPELVQSMLSQEIKA